MHSRIWMTLLAAALVISASLAATPAQAADGCYGDYCSGRDPSTTGVGNVPCANDAKSVMHADLEVYRPDYPGAVTGSWVKVGDLDLRWSPWCQTNWARASMIADTTMIAVSVTQSTGYTMRRQTNGWWGGSSPGVYWTNMIYSPVAACRAWVEGGSFRTSSTGWR